MTLFKVWLGTAISSTVYLLGYTVFYYYASLRITKLLKEKNPERYAWIKGKDLIGWGYEKRMTIQDRGRKWLNSDMDNDLYQIKNLKDNIKKHKKIAMLLFIYILISSLLVNL